MLAEYEAFAELATPPRYNSPMPDSRVIPRRKPKAYRFRPPRHVPALMAFGRLAAPWYLRAVIHVTDVEISADDRAKLEALRHERVVLTPNHPTHDPVVMFQLSSMLKMQYYWLAAREVFERPLQGWVVSRVGAYSVDRGVKDADALNTTRRLLKEGRHWLVLFPEGMEHYLHDAVLPFLPGAARLGLGALSDLAAGGDPPPLKLVPVASRYYYTRDMRPVMEQALTRLERHLDLDDPPPADWQARQDRISDVVLSVNEEYYGVPPEPGADVTARLVRLREVVIARVADSLGVPAQHRDKPLRNRVRRLMTIAHRRMQETPEAGGEYARELASRRLGWAGRLLKELRRVMEFVSITPDLAAGPPTVENYLDVIGRIEMEVFNKWRSFGPRRVQISVGEPVDLREYYARYQDDPDEASEAAMLEVEHRVRELLKSTAHLMTPLPESEYR